MEKVDYSVTFTKKLEDTQLYLKLQMFMTQTGEHMIILQLDVVIII